MRHSHRKLRLSILVACSETVHWMFSHGTIKSCHFSFDIPDLLAGDNENEKVMSDSNTACSDANIEVIRWWRPATVRPFSKGVNYHIWFAIQKFLFTSSVARFGETIIHYVWSASEKSLKTIIGSGNSNRVARSNSCSYHRVDLLPDRLVMRCAIFSYEIQLFTNMKNFLI